MSRALIWVASVPRSGSTWLSQMLAGKKSVVLSEPDNPNWNWVAYRRGIQPYTYLPKGARDVRLSSFFDFVFSVKLFGSKAIERFVHDFIPPFYTYPRHSTSFLKHIAADLSLVNSRIGVLNPLSRLALTKKRYVVIKSVSSLLLTEWLAAQFPIKPVILLRDPLSVAASWKRMGYLKQLPSALNRLLENPFLPILGERILEISGDSVRRPFVALGVFLGIHFEIIDQWMENYPDWLYLTHEDLAGNPLRAFMRAFNYAGIEFTDSVQARIERTTTKPGSGYSIFRESAKEIGKWKKELTKTEVDDLIFGFSPFRSRVYDLQAEDNE